MYVDQDSPSSSNDSVAIDVEAQELSIIASDLKTSKTGDILAILREERYGGYYVYQVQWKESAAKDYSSTSWVSEQDERITDKLLSEFRKDAREWVNISREEDGKQKTIVFVEQKLRKRVKSGCLIPDELLHVFSIRLKEKYPSACGLLPPAELRVDEGRWIAPTMGPGVQFHHQTKYGGHWVLSSYRLHQDPESGRLVGEYFIWDSLVKKKDKLFPSTRRECTALYTKPTFPSEVKLIQVKPVQQKGGIECGYYAAAYSVGVLDGIPPLEIGCAEFDFQKLRQWLVDVLSGNQPNLLAWAHIPIIRKVNRRHKSVFPNHYVLKASTIAN